MANVEKSIMFRLKSIREKSLIMDLSSELTDLQLNIGQAFGVELNQQEEIVSLSAKAIYLQGDRKLLECWYVFDYEFKNDDGVIAQVDNLIQMPTEFLATLLNDVFNILRGILFSKTQGTAIAYVILPPVDILNMIKQMNSPAPENKV